MQEFKLEENASEATQWARKARLLRKVSVVPLVHLILLCQKAAVGSTKTQYTN
jgi:hypothetical protein